MDRHSLFQLAERRYNSKPQYLWAKFPLDAVLRHADNHKWYALIMEVEGSKLGLKTADKRDIITVKADPRYIDILCEKAGYFPAYHMNKRHWISIDLAEGVADDEIAARLAESYALTAR